MKPHNSEENSYERNVNPPVSTHKSQRSSFQKTISVSIRNPQSGGLEPTMVRKKLASMKLRVNSLLRGVNEKPSMKWLMSIVSKLL